MSNYPDDIRDFDHDPRSPFYDDGGFEDACSVKHSEIEEDIAGHSDVIMEGLASLSDEDCSKFLVSLLSDDDKSVDANLILEDVIADIAKEKVESESES